MLRGQHQHLNALVLAGSATLSENRHEAAQAYWQRALVLVPADSEAGQGLQQAMARAAEMAAAPAAVAAVEPAVVAVVGAETLSAATAAGDTQLLIEGKVHVPPEVQSQIAAGATLFVYAMAEERSRRPVAIWRGTPTAWTRRFALSDRTGMGAPPMLSGLKQVRLVARVSKTGLTQMQPDDFQVELPGVKTRVHGVVLNIIGLTP